MVAEANLLIGLSLDCPSTKKTVWGKDFPKWVSLHETYHVSLYYAFTYDQRISVHAWIGKLFAWSSSVRALPWWTSAVTTRIVSDIKSSSEAYLWS